MEEYLTVRELSSRIKFSQQSIYNLIHKKVFVLGKHYFKPRSKKVLFKWSEIKAWIEGPPCEGSEELFEASSDANTPSPNAANDTADSTPKSLLNI